MNRFGMWFANLMRGRYGNDNLNRFLLIVSLILIIADMFVRRRLLYMLAVLILIYVYCRMFSRNINARYRENQKFLQFTAKFRRSGAGRGNTSYGGAYGGGQYGNAAGSGSAGWSRKAKPVKDKNHKIFKCPVCGEKLRVPKGAGKISITCPHCGEKFIKKV